MTQRPKVSTVNPQMATSTVLSAFLDWIIICEMLEQQNHIHETQAFFNEKGKLILLIIRNENFRSTEGTKN